MATHKRNDKKKPYHPQKTVKKSIRPLLWIAFFLLVIGLFVVNFQLIRRTVQNTHLLERLSKPQHGQQQPLPEGVADQLSGPLPQDSGQAGSNQELFFDTEASPPGSSGAAPPAEQRSLDTAAGQVLPAPQGELKPTPETSRQNQPVIIPKTEKPADTGGQSSRNSGTSAPLGNAPASLPPGSSTPVSAVQPEVNSAEIRQRKLYFMQVDNEGIFEQIPTVRGIPNSDSPLLDVVQALLAGPTTVEMKQHPGLRSFIPQGTRILGAAVQGTTAYLSFSEDFLFGTHGVEGYAAQLRQIVLTATEFSTVQDVQVLVEGRVVSYLGENIGIGAPIGRSDL